MTRKVQLELKHLVFAVVAIALYIVWLYPLYVSIVRYNNYQQVGENSASANATVVSLHKQRNYLGLIGRCALGAQYSYVVSDKLVTSEDKLGCDQEGKLYVGNTIPVKYDPSSPSHSISNLTLTPTLGNIARNFLFGIVIVGLLAFGYHYWRLPPTSVGH